MHIKALDDSVVFSVNRSLGQLQLILGRGKEICHHKVESEKTKPSQTMLTGWRLFIGVELFAQDRPEASR